MGGTWRSSGEDMQLTDGMQRQKITFLEINRRQTRWREMERSRQGPCLLMGLTNNNAASGWGALEGPGLT